MAFFESVQPSSPDLIFGLMEDFKKDPRPHKINLTVGYYRDWNLKTPVLKSVQKVELKLAEQAESKQYLPIEGDQGFIASAGALAFGEKLWNEHAFHIAGFQTVGGTGALRVGADFLKKEVSEKIWISKPTWPNHRSVFLHAGMHVGDYPYYDTNQQNVDFNGMCAHLSSLPEKSVIVLHTCCHNPTGADLSHSQWKELSLLFSENKLIPFFDTAYQGFADDLESDVYPLRLFVEDGHEMVVATSYAKNFSLYSERIGALYIVCKTAKAKENVLSKIRVLIRANYSNPPQHGAKIVDGVLTDKALKSLWESELSEMRERIDSIRTMFAEALIKKCKNRDYSYLLRRKGLFCFTGLHGEQVDRVIDEFAVYMTRDGRINVAGMNKDNLEYVANAISRVNRPLA